MQEIDNYNHKETGNIMKQEDYCFFTKFFSRSLGGGETGSMYEGCIFVLLQNKNNCPIFRSIPKMKLDISSYLA